MPVPARPTPTAPCAGAGTGALVAECRTEGAPRGLRGRAAGRWQRQRWTAAPVRVGQAAAGVEERGWGYGAARRSLVVRLEVVE
jgi:hypothetical protein